MSFGGSPSDIIIVVTFCRKLYKQCRDAGGEYLEISREVRGLHSVLRHLKSEVEAPESVLNRDRARYGKELAPVIGDCDFTLRKLDELLMKYGRLAAADTSGAARLWDRLRFGSAELDELGNIRMKLINHKTSITVFLNTIQLHESGRHTEQLESHSEQLDVILDKVDGIAARLGQRAPSILTTYDNDDKEVWRQFRRELVAEGFSSDVLHQNKEILRAYIRQIDQNGLLDDSVTSPTSAADTEHWLNSVPQVHSPMSDVLPSFESLNNHSEDAGAKMLISEDNMKFPQSLKAELAYGQKITQGDSSKQLLSPHDVLPMTRQEGIDAQPSSSRLKSRPSSRNGEAATKENRKPSLESPKVRTTEQISSGLGLHTINKSSQSLPIDEPNYASTIGLPSSYRSQVPFDDPARPIPYRPKAKPDPQRSATYNSSKPIQPPMPERAISSPAYTNDRPVHEPHGSNIPVDAKWTQLPRNRVSPEVLAQDGRQFEAGPGFVAILGVLSRDEIEDYAARTILLREGRRAGPKHRNHHRNRHDSNSEYTSSDSASPSSSSSDEESSSAIRRQRPRHRHHSRHSRPDRASQHSISYSTNPHAPIAMPVPQPDAVPRQYQQSYYMPPTPLQPIPMQIYHPPAPGGGSPQYSYTPGDDRKASKGKEREKEKEKEKEKGHKWRNGLTVVGLGGAAASLLHVLSDAADGL